MPPGRHLESIDDIHHLLERMHRVAVLGMKTEAQREQPAFYVPAYLANAGVHVVPVPVYYPDVTHILSRQVFRRVSEVPGEVDVVNVFRRPHDVPAHVDDIIAKKPRAVWMQLHIRNDAAAERFVDAGIDVVQDKCLLVEHRRWRAGR